MVSKFDVHYMTVAIEDLEGIPPEDRAEIEKVIKSIARNPYGASPIGAGLLGRLANWFRWLSRELELWWNGE